MKELIIEIRDCVSWKLKFFSAIVWLIQTLPNFGKKKGAMNIIVKIEIEQ